MHGEGRCWPVSAFATHNQNLIALNRIEVPRIVMTICSNWQGRGVIIIQPLATVPHSRADTCICPLIQQLEPQKQSIQYVATKCIAKRDYHTSLKRLFFLILRPPFQRMLSATGAHSIQYVQNRAGDLHARPAATKHKTRDSRFGYTT